MDRFISLFEGRENCHGHVENNENEEKISAWTHKYELVTEQEWFNHINGKRIDVGCCPIHTDNTCTFGAIDYDDESADHVEIEKLVRELDLPLVVCRSRSGGAHLYLFLAHPTPAGIVIDNLQEWSQELGLKNPNDRPLEIFPKQRKLEPNGQGSWISLPYYNINSPVRFAIIDGKQASFEEFLDYAEQKTIALVKKTTSKTLPVLEDRNVFVNGPPCLQVIEQEGGLKEGDRNTGLYNVGIYFQLSDPDNWEQKLILWNEKWAEPSYPEKELDTLIKSLGRTDYSYTCTQNPIVSRCDIKTCVTRRWGIHAGKSHAAGGTGERIFPDVKGIRKILADPPLYIINIRKQGDADASWYTIECTAPTLIDQGKWRRYVMDTIGVLPDRLKAPEWDHVIRELNDQFEIEVAPEAATEMGLFRQIAIEYLSRYNNAKDIDDVITGSPYLEKETNTVLFQSQYFLQFIRAQKKLNWPPGKIWSMIQNVGGTTEKRIVRNREVQLWTVSYTELFGEDTKDVWDSRLAEGTDF